MAAIMWISYITLVTDNSEELLKTMMRFTATLNTTLQDLYPVGKLKSVVLKTLHLGDKDM